MWTTVLASNFLDDFIRPGQAPWQCQGCGDTCNWSFVTQLPTAFTRTSRNTHRQPHYFNMSQFYLNAQPGITATSVSLSSSPPPSLSFPFSLFYTTAHMLPNQQLCNATTACNHPKCILTLWPTAPLTGSCLGLLHRCKSPTMPHHALESIAKQLCPSITQAACGRRTKLRSPSHAHPSASGGVTGT